MNQLPLMCEDIFEALRVDVMALGGAKKVGCLLWPELSADKAGEALNNCLNRTRREKLDIEQVMLIARNAKEVGSYAAMTFMAQGCGFTVPEPVHPEDEKAKLQRAFIESVELQRRILAQMERVGR